MMETTMMTMTKLVATPQLPCPLQTSLPSWAVHVVFAMQMVQINLAIRALIYGLISASGVITQKRGCGQPPTLTLTLVLSLAVLVHATGNVSKIQLELMSMVRIVASLLQRTCAR